MHNDAKSSSKSRFFLKESKSFSNEKPLRMEAANKPALSFDRDHKAAEKVARDTVPIRSPSRKKAEVFSHFSSKKKLKNRKRLTARVAKAKTRALLVQPPPTLSR